MKIKARFYVAEVAKKAYGNGAGYGEVVLQAVTRKTGDNVEWASATPSGRLTMTVNADALAFFDAQLGKDLYLTMEAVPDEAPAEG